MKECDLEHGVGTEAAVDHEIRVAEQFFREHNGREPEQREDRRANELAGEVAI